MTRGLVVAGPAAGAIKINTAAVGDSAVKENARGERALRLSPATQSKRRGGVKPA